MTELLYYIIKPSITTKKTRENIFFTFGALFYTNRILNNTEFTHIIVLRWWKKFVLADFSWIHCSKFAHSGKNKKVVISEFGSPIFCEYLLILLYRVFFSTLFLVQLSLKLYFDRFLTIIKVCTSITDSEDNCQLFV